MCKLLSDCQILWPGYWEDLELKFGRVNRLRFDILAEQKSCIVCILESRGNNGKIDDIHLANQ